MRFMNIRLATAADLSTLLALRLALYEELGAGMSDADKAALQAADRSYYSAQLAASEGQSSCRNWLAEREGQVLGLASLSLFVRPPYLGNLSGREAYLMNMYTVPACRGLGLARALLEAALHDAGQWGCKKVWLHASEAGRPLYQKLGFKPASSYMELL